MHFTTILKVIGFLIVIAYLPFFIKSRKGIWNYIVLPGVYLRMALCAITVISTCGIFTIIGLFTKQPRETLNVRAVFFLAPIIDFLMGVRIEFEGTEHITPETSPCVYISNHQSMMDVFIFPRCVHPKTIAVGKDSLKWIPIFGTFFWLAGNVLIDRSNHNSSVNKLNKACQVMLDKKACIFIMPEGTRYVQYGTMKEFKKGAFHLAVDAQVPIVPIVAENYYDKLYEAPETPFGRKTIHVKVLPPLSTKGITDKQGVDKLCKEARDVMVKALFVLNAKQEKKSQ